MAMGLTLKQLQKPREVRNIYPTARETQPESPSHLARSPPGPTTVISWREGTRGLLRPPKTSLSRWPGAIRRGHCEPTGATKDRTTLQEMPPVFQLTYGGFNSFLAVSNSFLAVFNSFLVVFNSWRWGENIHLPGAGILEHLNRRLRDLGVEEGTQ